MTVAALGLVLGSAFAHAAWNFLAKRTGAGTSLVPLVAVASAVIYAPAALVVALGEPLRYGWIEFAFIAGSAMLHTGYFLVLQRGYQRSDLSLVYPLARGSGPLLATVGAIALLGERPSSLALAGVALVTGGALVLVGAGWRSPGRARSGLVYGLLTATLIACYTLWDKHAVSALAMHPLLYDWGNGLGRVLLTLPLAACRRDQIRRLWRDHRLEVIGIALLSPLAYILVLSALIFAPVSYVAPAREISIVIGTVLGTHVLAEGDARRRFGASIAIVAGVVALSVG